MPQSPEQKIEEYIDSIDLATISRYRTDWDELKPKTDTEYYERWIFSFLSVHTTWKLNVSSFKTIKTRKVPATKDELFNLIVSTRVGLHNVRTDGLWRFHYDFWQDPQSWRHNGSENWQDFRDRLMSRCHGLKEAKTSFALELCYPDSCGVVCLDTHMLQLYGCTKKGSAISSSKYRAMEQHWLGCCSQRSLPSPLVRHVYWDKVQKQPDGQYWTHCLVEPKQQNEHIQTETIGPGQ